MRLNTISSGRGGSVVLFAALLVALCPSDAFAVWGQNWGTMVWGAAAPSGATLPAWGLGLLACLLLAISVSFLKKGKLSGTVTGMVTLLFASSLAVFAVPNTFTNGTAADAGQVNANFTSVASDIAAAGGSVSIPNTFVNGTTADAALVNANFTAIAASVASLGGSLSVPNTFSNGTTADAAQVNGNFVAVDAAIAALPPAGMVAIPAGTNAGTDPDFGAYSLTVSAFYMDKYEVSKDQWDAVKTWGASNGYTDLAAGAGKAGTHPVQTVDWYNVVKWCNARSEQAGLTPAYYTDAGYTTVYRTGTVSGVAPPYVNGSANGYRLPTDEEWEYAARGGAVSKRFPWNDSDNISHTRANYYASGGYAYDDSDGASYHPTYNDATTPYTSPSGAFAANGYGLYDMAGNVLEWCYSWYPGFEGSYRVLRGGCWTYPASYNRVGFRYSATPSHASDIIGFRAVLPPGP
jgi:sulfatase modifying factor 1